jgi:imidazolonepropionase-like amidohydrolase
MVARLAGEGWIALKVYQSLTLPVYDAVMAAARARGVLAMGHVPTAVTVQHALASGQRSIEHLGGYDRAVSRQGRIGTWAWIDVDASKFTTLAQATAQAGTWNCPTLAIFRTLAQRHTASERAAIVENRRRFVRELARQGAPLLVGTDAGIDVVAPGSSIHDELSELVAAGFTPYEALLGATREAGRFLGVAGLGTVAAGAPAQLVLLEANPLANIANAQRVSGIVLAGEWFSVSRLQEKAGS